MNEPEYIVPAAEPLTVLHVADPDVGGFTRCGKPLEPDELWRPIDYRPGDRICRDCGT